jgi:hypothetical protein
MFDGIGVGAVDTPFVDERKKFLMRNHLRIEEFWTK